MRLAEASCLPVICATQVLKESFGGNRINCSFISDIVK